jgi:predicted transcriptional regulator
MPWAHVEGRVLVASFARDKGTSADDLTVLLEVVHATLCQLGPKAQPSAPDVPAGAECLVSLEDGRKYKILTGHLSARGLSPQEYRRKWGLPDDYPMVAPGYSVARSRALTRRLVGS